MNTYLSPLVTEHGHCKTTWGYSSIIDLQISAVEYDLEENASFYRAGTWKRFLSKILAGVWSPSITLKI